MRASADPASASQVLPTISTARRVRAVHSQHIAESHHLEVVHLAAECWPFARTGGLGEAVAGLAAAQAARGVGVSVVMPLYRTIRESGIDLREVGAPFTIAVGTHLETVRLYRTAVPPGTARIFFVDHTGSFDRQGIYGEGGCDYPDNARRFALFSRAAIAALPRIAPGVGIVHAHDWHAAIGIAFHDTGVARHAGDPRPAKVLSVHNAGFQGRFGAEAMADTGCAAARCESRPPRSDDRMNFLESGLAHCDLAVTVSPSHARELRTPDGGFGLHDTFDALGDRLVGVANGIDTGVWNPVTDMALPARYTREDIAGKAACKAELQRSCGLEERPSRMLIAMCSRLAQQKGFDLVLEAGLLAQGDAQYVIVGRGEARYETALADLAAAAPRRVALRLDFSDELEHRLLAGADALLMPSFYEPCGLTQMRAQRYGTIPIARRVGGLADTIEDDVTGFLFTDYSREALIAGVGRAAARYADSAAWTTLMQRAMARDFGWPAAAEEYIALYTKLAGRTSGVRPRARPPAHIPTARASVAHAQA